MKKSIVYLSLALALSVNAFASDFSSSTYYSSNPLCVAISKGDSETAKKFLKEDKKLMATIRKAILKEVTDREANGASPVKHSKEVEDSALEA